MSLLSRMPSALAALPNTRTPQLGYCERSRFLMPSYADLCRCISSAGGASDAASAASSSSSARRSQRSGGSAGGGRWRVRPGGPVRIGGGDCGSGLCACGRASLKAPPPPASPACSRRRSSACSCRFCCARICSAACCCIPGCSGG